jgi:hypothetical protein
MDYEEMSNEVLQELLTERFPRPLFQEVTEYNRQAVIALLEASEEETRRPENVQPEDK